MQKLKKKKKKKKGKLRVFRFDSILTLYQPTFLPLDPGSHTPMHPQQDFPEDQAL